MGMKGVGMNLKNKIRVSSSLGAWSESHIPKMNSLLNCLMADFLTGILRRSPPDSWPELLMFATPAEKLHPRVYRESRTSWQRTLGIQLVLWRYSQEEERIVWWLTHHPGSQEIYLFFFTLLLTSIVLGQVA